MNNSQRWPDRYTEAERSALQGRADDVSRALSKLPAEPGTTYRGVDLPDEVLGRYEPGEIVTEQGFTSTSRSPGVANGEFDGNTLFVIDGQNGRDIAPYSQFPDEAEVLYDAGTDFQVVTKEWDENLGKWVIHVEEVVP